MSVTVSVKTKAILLTAVILTALFVTMLGIIYFQRRIPSTGGIKSIGCQVFWDAELTQNVTAINWGILAPGEEKNSSVYVLNTSNFPVQLMLGTENWFPAGASDYIALYWNYNNQTLAVNEAIPVTLTLEVSADITGIESFSFYIIIIAYG